MSRIDVVEASIAELRAALESGDITSEGLLDEYMARMDAYDVAGPMLNSVIVRNPRARSEAQASDRRRSEGRVLGPLDGIVYTAKDSYLVEGLTAAAGSPAFGELVAQSDAFTIERLRAAGAICVGLTNMPPMANGGMQRGLYGRAESPYKADRLTSAFGSGSSNGSGTATASSFAAFGLAEETWSSGRAPASCNALFAYTPSRGVISVRGNWPLVPTMDVVVPHARTASDLAEILDVVVADDETARGDFWRVQDVVPIPKASEVRPDSYTALVPESAVAAKSYLKGKTLGVPRMYINQDPDAGTAENPGIGGSTGQPIRTRESVVTLWERARADLEAAGARVVEVDFPVVTRYEGDRPGEPTVRTRGFVTGEYLDREISELSAWAWDDFLRSNADPNLPDLTCVDGDDIFPHPDGALADRYDGFDDDIATYPDLIRECPIESLDQIPEIREGLPGLEKTRQVDLEEWMEERGLDAVVFPALADVAPADMDVNPESADQGWRNGVWVANGNLAIRHLGIPTVTVPMGTLDDIEMPVGLTFAGRAYSDNHLLELGFAFDALGPRRTEPKRTPRLNR
ncbi:amidase [Kocuria sp. HSID16901]|uniref:amidase n=1 Tax=Kocuria sp. HSID16901 TaxID=2419505 RepID=UPI000660E16C|nr:amidase [Kocuria sp. HSID16901]MCT1366991.1 amidase [Rothia sp. p3-SID1597]RUQ19874.1 amidase [Kocuria sp. HSID16901]